MHFSLSQLIIPLLLFNRLKTKTYSYRLRSNEWQFPVPMYLGEVIEAGLAAEFFGNQKEVLTKEYLDGYFI